MWLSGNEIGARVWAIRKALGYTQQQLAEALKRPGSQKTIGLIENNRFWVPPKRPDPRLLEEIAALAGYELDHFRVDGGLIRPGVSETIVVINWLEKMVGELRAQVPFTGPDASAPHDELEALVDAQVDTNIQVTKNQKRGSRRR